MVYHNSLSRRRVPHFRLTSDIGNLWEGYGGPTMGVLTTVDVIQAIPDVWGCAERSFVISRLDADWQRDPWNWNAFVCCAGTCEMLWRFCVSDRYGVGNESGTYPNYGQMTIGVPKDHPTIGDSGLTLVEAQSHFR